MSGEQGQLFLPNGVGAPGFLLLPTAADEPIPLTARLTSLVVQLELTRQKQLGWHPRSRGWMSPQLISRALGEGPKEYVVSAGTVRKYIGRIQRELDKHLPDTSDGFKLFERQPMLGYRLAIPIQVLMPDS